MSDFHYPILCLVMLCKPTVSIKNENVMHTDRKYVIDKRSISNKKSNKKLFIHTYKQVYSVYKSKVFKSIYIYTNM